VSNERNPADWVRDMCLCGHPRYSHLTPKVHTRHSTGQLGYVGGGECRHAGCVTIIDFTVGTGCSGFTLSARYEGEDEH